MRVGLSRMMLGSVGVKSRSQIGSLPVHGDAASDYGGCSGAPGVCIRSWYAKHCPTLIIRSNLRYEDALVYGFVNKAFPTFSARFKHSGE